MTAKEVDLAFRYDEESDVFAWTVEGGMYIVSPWRSRELHSPGDHPTKNTTVYRGSFYDTIDRSKPPIFIGAGREAYIAALICKSILDGIPADPTIQEGIEQ